MANKTNYSYIGIAFILLVFGIIFIPKIVNRVKDKDIVREDLRSTDINKKNFTETTDLMYLNINGERKKVPEFSFVNQDGDTISNKDYLGKVYVAEFFFTTCPSICPKMNRNLVQIQNTFDDFENFGVASFTITPSIDTPEVLKQYAKNYGITNPNWHLMTGDKDKIYDLANQGFNIYVGENLEVEGGFEHSGNFALIDKEGFIRSRSDNYGNPMIFYRGVLGENEQPEDDEAEQEISILKEDIAKLLEE
ncbi:protein SCO1/2 [Flavobacteriaceae bacterium MAR_2010_188]|nr:protein SCO1/2 [Flavobacteriaceae bacterium MAR_2010_188]